MGMTYVDRAPLRDVEDSNILLKCPLLPILIETSCSIIKAPVATIVPFGLSCACCILVHTSHATHALI